MQELFHAAAELPVAEQDDFLSFACGQDHRLREAVVSLLAAERNAATGWDHGALETEARQTARDSNLARPGETFGPYRILRRVATGGMSFVYEAMRDDAEFHKRVAIKFVQQGFDDPVAFDRFRSERQILAQLEHPCIARILDGGTTDDGVPYLVMEYVDGVPIDRFVTERQLSRSQRLKLFLQVCEAVAYAHRNSVVHRDLKPANILVTPDGLPKLLDFGIAKLLNRESDAATVRALTPEYASPEQVAGQSTSTSTDVYSLGVLLFVLLAGRLPYLVSGSQTAQLVRAICEVEPVWQPMGLIHGDLRSILAQALRKEADRRYQSVELVAADIRRYMEGLPVAARPDGFVYRARKFIVRRALLLAALSAMEAAVLVLTITAVSVPTGFYAWERWSKHKNALALVEDGFRLVRGGSVPEIAEAKSTFSRAVELDPKLALAYAGLAEAMARSVDGSRSHAKEMAERSLRVDPTCAECQGIAGWILLSEDWQFDSALDRLQKAARQKPEDTRIRLWNAQALASAGRLDEALQEIDQAVKLRPADAAPIAMRAGILYFMRRYDEAIDAARFSLGLHAGYTAANDWIYRAGMAGGRVEEALEAKASLTASFTGLSVEARQAYEHRLNEAYRSGGVELLVRTLLEETSEGLALQENRYDRAALLMKIDDRDGALDELEHVFEWRPFHCIYAGVDPAFAPIRDEPRFRNVLARIGLNKVLIGYKQ
jgi:tetratricopeptide (TPR) repeat protein/tRNA A-37 threonylcarbamoyl transferase component Bud32